MTESPNDSFLALADDRFEQFVSKIPLEMFDVLCGRITWTEKSDVDDLYFAIEVLEKTNDYFHVGIGVTSYRIAPMEVENWNVEICKSYIIKR